jgi:hypothetical protein
MGGNSRWYDRVGGIDYADSAFKWAQSVDSNALLFYNDFGAEGMNNKSQNVYDLVSGLKARGAPIHGVGLQCHFNLTDHDTAAIGQNMRRLAALGFVISMTEIDIQTSNTVQNLETQKARYKALAKLCLDVPACKSFYAWGVNDAQSWRGANAVALLFTGTSAMTPKPAYWGVVEALEEGSSTTSMPSAPWGVIASPGAGATSKVVSWRPPVTDGRSPITGYKATVWGDTTRSCTTTGASSCTISGLSADTSYRFAVRAINAVGVSGMSPPSTTGAAPVSVAPVPHEPAAGRFTSAYAFRLSDDAAKATGSLQMTLSDVSGRIVWSRTVHPARSGLRDIAWDGTTQSGAQAPNGAYIVRIRTAGEGVTQEFVRRSVKLR